MDYCSSCRRHLNGALVCPGCGAYAPDIAPSAAGGPGMPVATGAAATGAAPWDGPAVDTWYDDYFQDEAVTPSGADEAAPAVPSGMDEPVSDDVEGVPAAPQGRAARRRQRAQWKKNQRRAVVATAVALVGGGLTVASMDRQSGDKAQAAAAPEKPNTEATERQQTERTRPASTPPDTHKAQRTPATPSKASPTNAARESITTPHTTRQFTRPDAGTAPRTAPTEVPQAQTVSPASEGTNSGDGSDTAPEQQQTPAPTATEGTDTQTPPPQTSPAPDEETSPAQLCVLNVVCLG